MKRINWLLILVGLLMACTATNERTDVLSRLPERYSGWHLPAPPDDRDTRAPAVWLGAGGNEAVLGTGSSFTIADKDPNAPQVSGMPAPPSELGDMLATANLAADGSAVVIVADEVGAIKSVAAWVQPWADITPDNFALFAGREVTGTGKQDGDVFAYTLEPLGKVDDVLLVVSINFDNSRASGDIVSIWRLNAKAAATATAEAPLTPSLTPIPSGTLSRFSGCWIIEPPPPVTLRLAWIEAGDLWIWDWQDAEPYMLPAAGEVTGVRLTSEAQTILFVQKVQSGSELWAMDADGSNPRLLTGGEQLTGSLEMLSPSPDEQLLAFTHLLPEGGGELWAASLDGSGARRLVSHADLMAIVAEPLADFATPAGVTWMPDTHILTYDAYLGFKNEGIYIFVQRQVMLVDADSGAQEVLLPFGEGGQVAYSPDGATMTIVTPDRLRLMDLASRTLHEADFQYFAVGFGEYYAHPPLAWTQDSQTLLVAQPDAEAANQDWPFIDDVPVTIWSLQVDGSPATRKAEFTGFFPSFAFSPDGTKLAYWRAVAPQSNTRQLHLAALDGSQHVVYETDEVLEFLSWGPDSQTFVFTTGGPPGNARLANICVGPVQMGLDFYPANLTWLDPIRFLFERREVGSFELYLGGVEDPESPTLLLNLEQFGGFDFAVLPVR